MHSVDKSMPRVESVLPRENTKCAAASISSLHSVLIHASLPHGTIREHDPWSKEGGASFKNDGCLCSPSEQVQRLHTVQYALDLSHSRKPGLRRAYGRRVP